MRCNCEFELDFSPNTATLQKDCDINTIRSSCLVDDLTSYVKQKQIPFSSTLTIHSNHFTLLIGCYVFDMFVDTDFFAVTGQMEIICKDYNMSVYINLETA